MDQQHTAKPRFPRSELSSDVDTHETDVEFALKLRHLGAALAAPFHRIAAQRLTFAGWDDLIGVMTRVEALIPEAKARADTSAVPDRVPR